METIVSCRAVTKGYDRAHPEILALRGADLTVERGELLAIMGPSGGGKSTLLHLVGGLDTPTSGEVTVVGKRIDRLSEAARAKLRRRHVGYVFQAFNLVSNLSVADNVELPVLLAGGSPAEARARRTELLARVGLGVEARKAPSQRSGGPQQRVAIARALANQPELLLADEPTGNLDSAMARQVLELLAEQHDAGQTIVLVTDDPRVAAAATRLVILEDGRVVDDHADPLHAPGAVPLLGAA